MLWLHVRKALVLSFFIYCLWAPLMMENPNLFSDLDSWVNADYLEWRGVRMFFSCFSCRSYVKFSNSLLALSHGNQFFRHPTNLYLCENMIPALLVSCGMLECNTACMGVLWLSCALCRDQGFAVSKAKQWKCENSHCLKDCSELRDLHVVYIFCGCLWRIEGLLYWELSPAALAYS